MHFNERSSISQIINALFIPYSSVSWIISEFNTNPKMSSNWFESTTVRVSESKIIKKAIVSYVNKAVTYLILLILSDILNKPLM